MENSVLTDLLVQVNVRELRSQAERERLASIASASAPRTGEALLVRLTRVWRTTQPRSLADLRQELASR